MTTYCEICNEPLDQPAALCGDCRRRMDEWNAQTPADRRATEARHPAGRNRDPR